MNNYKKAKVVEFIKNNIINYMYFATSLFTIDELDEFERLDGEDDISSCERWKVSLGVKYDRHEFDKYINRISKMKTHITGNGQWERMCIRNRREILTRFKTAFELTKPENYGKMNATIDREIVNDLFDKNKEQLTFNN